MKLQPLGEVFTVTVEPRTLKGVCRLLGGTYHETGEDKRCHIQLTRTSYLVIERDDRLEIYTVSERTKRLHKIVETSPPDKYVCTVANDTVQGPVSTTCNFEINIQKLLENVSAPEERVVVNVSPIQGTVSVRHYSVGVVVSDKGEPVEALMPLGGKTLRISEIVQHTFVKEYKASVEEALKVEKIY